MPTTCAGGSAERRPRAIGDLAQLGAPAPRSKVGHTRALLASPGGASLPLLCEATGWQSHSMRAALTGLRKAGAQIAKAKREEGTTIHRIAADAEQDR